LATKSLEFVNQEDRRPIKLFFQDEARFGRIDNVSSCWVPPRSRAVVGKQIIRQYTYLYGAFCPETGEQFSMILPYANGECMSIFMQEFSKQFADYRVVMGMDNASWHSSNITEKLDNIVPLFQPAHSPELNPAENIWHYVRESGHFKNRTFQSMEEVEKQLTSAANTLLTDKEKIKSITGFSWIKKILIESMIAVEY
jgi:transposase